MRTDSWTSTRPVQPTIRESRSSARPDRPIDLQSLIFLPPSARCCSAPKRRQSPASWPRPSMPTWKLARQAVRNGHPLPDEVSTASTTGSLCAAKQQSAAVKGNKGTRRRGTRRASIGFGCGRSCAEGHVNGM